MQTVTFCAPPLFGERDEFMRKHCAIILAAGKGTRMKSSLCKVLHLVAGKPMVSYVAEAVRSSRVEKIVIVVGHRAHEVQQCVGGPGIEFALQEPQLGTGHAVRAAEPLLYGFEGDLLILCGDIPLIEPATIEALLSFHAASGGTLTVATTFLDRPQGYGRIVRNQAGEVLRIVEDKEAGEQEKEIREVNTGIYAADPKKVFPLLKRVGPDNAQGEYYLTDVVAEAVKAGFPVQPFVVNNPREVIGVNTRADLAAVSRIVWDRRRDELMLSGVTLLDPDSVYVDSDVTVGPDTIIYPSVTISGRTEIGRECVIESGVFITDCVLRDRVKILLGSRLDSSLVEKGTSVGPMAHLRPGTKVGKNARIGNFVEVKKTVVGDGSKAAHLTYLGDSTIGREVNIGCGTITCNYDGKAKHPTVIRDRCFVGSDVQFVAPVEIGEGSVIGAGSTITKDVPPNSLAVSRAKQKNYPLREGQGKSSSDENPQP